MGFHFSGLTVDDIIHHDLRRGSLLLAVNAEHLSVDIGEWRQAFDGVAVIFLLDAIHGAAVAALVDGANAGFFCADDPAGGRIAPAGRGRLWVTPYGGDALEVSGFELIAATAAALMQIAEFLATQGHADAAARILVREVTRRRPP